MEAARYGRDTPFEAPGPSTQPPNPRAHTPWLLGRSLPNLAGNRCVFGPKRVYGEKRGHA